MMNGTRRRVLATSLASLCLLVTFASGGAAAQDGESTPATASRVLVYSVPTLQWEDLAEYDTPNLDRLLAASAVGDLSVRSVTRRTSAVDGYATLNAGTRTEGTPQGSLAFVAGATSGSVDQFGDPTEVPPGAFETPDPDAELPAQPIPPPEPDLEQENPDGTAPPAESPVPEAGETYDGSPAAEEFARRTGVLPGLGEVFNFGIVSMRQLNDSLLFDSEVGALGDALVEGGMRPVVIANGDHGLGEDEVDYRREASIGLMNHDGLVERGRVGRTLLEVDPSAPFGTRYDNPVVSRAFVSLWRDDSVVLVEASDLVRYEDAAPLVLESQRERFRRQAVESSDELLGMLLEEVDPERDAVVVVAPYASNESTSLTVVGVSAPGLEPGLLSSGTTRRAGFAQTVDIAPTILDLVGLEKPSSMEGTVIQTNPGGADAEERAEFLAAADDAARFRDRTLGGASVVFVLAQLGLWVLAVWTLARPGRRLRTVTEVGTLAVIGFLPVTYFAGAFPFHDWGSAAWWGFVLGMSAVLGATMQALGRRYLVDPLMLALGFVVALLSVDILFGGPLQFNTVFGYSPTVAGRFNGLGNPAFSMLTAAGIILAALVAHRVRGSVGTWCAVALLGWCVILDGAPMLGADVGGALSLVPAAGVTAFMLLGWRIRLRTVVLGAAATVLVVIGFGALDLLRPESQQTHLGRLLSDIGANGAGAFETVVLRKLNANLSVLNTSIWTLMLPLVFAAVAFVFWWAPWRLRTIAERIPEERAAVAGLIVAMVLGFALNDSGISVPGIMLGVVSASLMNLLLRVDDGLPSTPGEAPTPGSPVQEPPGEPSQSERTKSTEPSPEVSTGS